MVGRCAATTAAGSPCSAQPVRPSGFCYWHDPSLVADRAEARRRGGRAKSNQQRARKQLPAAALTPAELQGLLSMALQGVLSGRLSPGVGNAAANLGRSLIAAREAVEVEERLNALETAALRDGWRAKA